MKIDAVIHMKNLPEYSDVSDTVINRWQRSEDLPQSINLGARGGGWRRSVVDAWMAQRAKDAEATRKTQNRTR